MIEINIFTRQRLVELDAINGCSKFQDQRVFRLRLFSCHCTLNRYVTISSDPRND